MPKIQVVVGYGKVHYLGYSREIAKSIFNALCHRNIRDLYWLETDEGTEINHLQAASTVL